MSSISRKKQLLFSAIITLTFFGLLESAAHVAEVVSPQYKRADRKQAGTFRIFVYGESTVAGHPVEQLGFVSQLRFWLGEVHPDKRFEVLNFGMGGQSSTVVRESMEFSIGGNPDLVILLTGHNEFLRKDVENRLLSDLKTNSALVRTIVRTQAKVETRLVRYLPRNRFVRKGYPPVNRESDVFKQKVKTYAYNIERMTRMAVKRGIPVIIMTNPSNMSDWSPVRKGLDRASTAEYEAVIAEASRLPETRTPEGRARLEELLRTYPGEATLMFFLAKADANLNKVESAKALFMKAKDLDPLPWRALSDFNEILRNTAKGNRVFLVDVDRIFQQRSETGLVGFSLIADNCHPTPLGNAIIAREIISVMKNEHLFVQRDLNEMEVDAQLDYFLTHFTNRNERRSLEQQYLMRNAIYCMKTPFYNFSAARMYFERALAQDSSDWKIWANLATLSLLEDRVDEGLEQLRKAIKLRGQPLDPADTGHTPYLKGAIDHAKVALEDLH